MNKDALIGYTGFVGSNVSRHHSFSETFHSKNIDTIKNKNFDLVVCAGAPAAKWIANREPEQDYANIQLLIESLSETKAKTFILISTVDVYKNPVGVDEESPVEVNGLHPYGLHRYHLETFVKAHFNSFIIRLPGLFGTGLKKNFVFDLLNNNNIEQIDGRGRSQLYSLEWLWQDIQHMVERDIRLLNASTEPVTQSEVAEKFFQKQLLKKEGIPPPLYDFRSRYATEWKGDNGYLYNKDAVMEELGRFISAYGFSSLNS